MACTSDNGNGNKVTSATAVDKVEVPISERGEILINDVDFQGKSAKDAYEAATNVNYFFTYAFINEQKKMVGDG